MTSRYFLLEQKNPHGEHFYRTRRQPLRVIVVHITAGLEDLDGVNDHSAEKTARYAATTARAVSWHSGSDSDSHLYLLPASHTAFHCRNYNSSTYGHEISKKTTSWAAMPGPWVAATIRQAALALAPIVREYDIPLVQLTRAQVDAGHKGFASHADLDPTRRRDPGPDFPWHLLFDEIHAVLFGEGDEVNDADHAKLQAWIQTALNEAFEVRDGEQKRQTKLLERILAAVERQ